MDMFRAMLDPSGSLAEELFHIHLPILAVITTLSWPGILQELESLWEPKEWDSMGSVFSGSFIK